MNDSNKEAELIDQRLAETVDKKQNPTIKMTKKVKKLLDELKSNQWEPYYIVIEKLINYYHKHHVTMKGGRTK